MTILESAKKRIITDKMKQVAIIEGVSEEFIRRGIANGEIVILKSKNHVKAVPVAVGAGLSTKVSASVGMYDKNDTVANELDKIFTAVSAGADTIMDLSVINDIDTMRRTALTTITKPMGSLPLYQAMAEAKKKKGSSLEMTIEDLFEVIERHAIDGIDFLALHCGTTMEVVNRVKKQSGNMSRIDF